MDFGFFLRGLVVGFSIAAPVGPIGVLCIRRTLADGRAVGFASGLGAATADGLYGAVAGFGLTAVSSLLVRQQFWLALFGGTFLCYLGLKTFVAKPAEAPTAVRSQGLARAYGSTLLLTLTNPATILSFVAVFAGMGLSQAAGDYSAASWMVAGVFLGSAGWWMILSLGVGVLRGKLSPASMRWVNRLSGTVLLAFGVVAVVAAVSH